MTNPARGMRWRPSRWLVTVLGLGIVLGAAILRFHGLGSRSLSQDESTMLEFLAGLMTKGYPSLYRGGVEIPMATYELVPYVMAPFVQLFGWSAGVVRLPAAFFGIATTWLVFRLSLRWFDWRVAAWAALLYALTPWAIFWAQNCFYPSQQQFFAVLSVALVHRLLSDGASARDCYLTALVLSLSYLTWEAGGLLFLVYGILALWLQWGRWTLLRNPHAWAAMILVIAVVLVQLVRRTLLQTPPYLVVGSSRAEISTPQIAWTQPDFNPFYYIDIFFSESFFLLTLLFLAGLLMMRRDFNWRFIVGFVLLALLVYTGLLPVQATRYVYAVLPFFLLAAAATSVAFFDWLRRRSSPAIPPRLRWLVTGTAALVLGLQSFLVSDLSTTVERGAEQLLPGSWELRTDIAETDFRGVMAALQSGYRPGDLVIVRAPFLLSRYLGLSGDYAVQRVTSTIVVYVPQGAVPFFRDKWIGNPVLRDWTELDAVLSRHDRVWVVAAPLSTFKEGLGGALFDLVHRSMEIAFEGRQARLYLYDKGAARGVASGVRESGSRAGGG